MKRLYITDLDGTLLTSEAQLSNRSKDIINSLIDGGLLFSIATARTHATVSEMFSDVKLNVPLVMMNGVIVYDPVEKKVISAAGIEREAASKVLQIFFKHGKAPMLYYPDGNKINIYIHSTKPLFDRNGEFKFMRPSRLQGYRILCQIVCRLNADKTPPIPFLVAGSGHFTSIPHHRSRSPLRRNADTARK